MNKVNSFFNRISHSAIPRFAAIIMIALACSSPVFCQGIFGAALNGDLAKVKALLKDNPALVFSKDSSGRTALFFAASNGYSKDIKDIVALLLANKADVNARGNKDGETSLYIFDVLNYLKVVDGKDGETPLFIAADADNMAVAKLLLANKADVNARDRDGETPLEMAIVNFGSKAMVQLLLANNADINAKDNDGSTPLHVAARKGDKDMVTLLLANNADVNAEDKIGRTPLQMAEVKGNNDVAEVLRQYINNQKEGLGLMVSLGVLGVAALGYVMWCRRKKRIAVRLSEPED